MRKHILISSLIVTGVFLTACIQSPVSSSSSNAIPSSTQNSISETPGGASSGENPRSNSIDDISSSSSETAGTSTSVPTDSPLHFYSTIEEVPYAKLGYADNRNGLTKEGELWVAAPSTYKFGDHCFSDGKTLYIQVFTGDSLGGLGDDFYWLNFCFDHFHPNESVAQLSPEADNKLFVRAEGYTVYTEDGESFTIPECQL